MFGFFIGSSRERALGRKRFFSASLAAPAGIADVSSTESQRCQPPTLGKAFDVLGRTTRNSPIRIGVWNVVPHQQFGIRKNCPKQPTSPVSTHGEVVKTNKSETFDPICFDPTVNIARRSPRSGPGRTTVTRPEQPICRKSSECHSEVHIGAHKFDRLMQSVLTRSDRFVPMLHANFRSL